MMILHVSCDSLFYCSLFYYNQTIKYEPIFRIILSKFIYENNFLPVNIIINYIKSIIIILSIMLSS